MDVKVLIKQIDRQYKEQGAIYHNMAVKYGLSDCAMWLLCIISEDGEVCTQKELGRKCFYAKQTINTVITKLTKSGYVKLEMIPGTRNQKKIILTEKGRELTRATTDQLKAAELRAYAVLTDDELKAYLDMVTRLTVSLREETEKL